MKRQIIIAFAYLKPKKLKSFLMGKTIGIYAGEDISNYELLKHYLSDVVFISPAQFNQFVDDKRGDFVDWMEKIHTLYGYNFDHWITDTFSSNPYGSKLFLYCMELLFFKSVVCNEANCDKDIVFISENFTVLKIANKIASNIAEADVLMLGSLNGFLHLCYKIVKRLVAGVARVLFFIIRYIISIASYKKCKKNDKEKIKDPLIIMDSYLLEGSFDKKGIFKNRYFTALHEFLNNQNIHSMILPFILDWKPWKLWTTYMCMRTSDCKFIILEDYATLADFLTIFKFPFKRIMNMEKVPDFQGIDMQALVDEENWFNLLSFSHIVAVLLYNLPKNLCNAGISPKLYLNWSENQTIHRAIILGFRKYLTNVYIVGGKPFVPPLNHLNLFNTTSERVWKVAPDKIVACGEKLKNLFSQYDINGVYEVGASYRYAYLWDIVATDCTNLRESKNILILLPYKRDLAVYMLRLLSSAILNTLNRDYNFIIKGHHAYMKGEIHSMIYNAGIKDNRLIITDNDIKSILLSSKAIITSASSVLCEAICVGIPVVLIAPPVGLDLNMNTVVPDSMWRIAYDEKDVTFLLNHWALNHPLSIEERRKIGKDTLESLFKPNSDKYLKAYLT